METQEAARTEAVEIVDEVGELVRRGREQRLLHDAAAFQEAVPLLREALEADPASAAAYAELALTYAAWGLRRENACLGFRSETRRVEFQSLYDLAYDCAAMALRLNPELPAAHRAMAAALRRGAKADPERRSREALLAAELGPDDPENACELWRAEGYDPDDAALRRALDENPQLLGVRLDLAESLCQRGRFAESLHELRAALKANPHNLQAYYDAAMALDRQGRRETAREILRKARALDPADALIEQGLALIGEAL